MLLLSEEEVRGLFQEIRPWGMTYPELFHLLDGLNVVLFDYENLDMAEWNDVYRGGVRDLVADILKKAGTPLHIDVIMEKVLLDYPYTNKKSVASSLGSDRERFVMMGEGYYGLRGKRKDG